ncbi:lytic transglycosylase domain-containing protein [Bradyrhizobium sp. BR 1433]|uniref:lytic transglycosylase domain-containing protein n=1 Tax=Bradyrhizobium sp. BR 1433 TaxID=3447967 RepID=UPI003EE4FAAB
MAQSGARVWVVVSLLLATHCAALAHHESAALPAICEASISSSEFIEEASQRFAIPAQWICSVLSIESSGDVHARSPKGARGLMQIMPATWAELRERYDLGSDPYDPRDNILAGTAYLRELLDRYGSPGVFAAYNAGPSRYEEHLAGSPLPDETRAYVSKLAKLLGIELPPTWIASQQLSAATTLFVARPDLIKAGDRTSAFMPPTSTATAISSRDILQMVPRAAGVFIARSDAGSSR